MLLRTRVMPVLIGQCGTGERVRSNRFGAGENLAGAIEKVWQGGRDRFKLEGDGAARRALFWKRGMMPSKNPDVLRRRFEKRAEQLGMPEGTACGKLRKNILFHFLTRLGENICYRCGCAIESADTLSIDHKEPWFNNDPKLFWDICNIAFSHLSCNSSAGRGDRVPANKKHCPEDMRWCSGCQCCRSKNDFYTCRRKDRREQYYGECKLCRKRRQRKPLAPSGDQEVPQTF